MKKLIISLILVSCAFETQSSLIRSIEHTVRKADKGVQSITGKGALDKDGKTLKKAGLKALPTAVGIGTGVAVGTTVSVVTSDLGPEVSIPASAVASHFAGAAAQKATQNALRKKKNKK